MEAEAAECLWGHSLNYTTFLGAGDSSAFTAVHGMDGPRPFEAWDVTNQ